MATIIFQVSDVLKGQFQDACDRDAVTMTAKLKEMVHAYTGTVPDEPVRRSPLARSGKKAVAGGVAPATVGKRAIDDFTRLYHECIARYGREDIVKSMLGNGFDPLPYITGRVAATDGLMGQLAEIRDGAEPQHIQQIKAALETGKTISELAYTCDIDDLEDILAGRRIATEREISDIDIFLT